MQIEQIDRDAAADITQWHFPNTPGAGDGIRAGQFDHEENVQIIARHRLAHRHAAHDDSAVERVAKRMLEAIENGPGIDGLVDELEDAPEKTFLKLAASAIAALSDQ